MRVIEVGRLKQRSYKTPEGQKCTVYEIEVDEVGPSLRSASAKVNRSSRSSSLAAPAEDSWAAEPGGSGFSDEPPFRG